MRGLFKCLYLFLIIFFVKCSTITSIEKPPYCPEDECSALLQFKQSFTIDASASIEGAYPKVLSWNSTHGGGKNMSCCEWDGVECDEKTGYVIGLHLQSSCLYGTINSTSSLFCLVHLRWLSLADNHFNYSQIPTNIRNFPNLTHLNLYASVFSGQVPAEVSHLVKLSFLDLSDNQLKLDGSKFKSLVQNLTNLEYLSLRYINISSVIPYSMANLSSLKVLDLTQCEVYGDFPVNIFHLKNFESLYLRDNPYLNGYLPEFNKSSRLITLDVHNTRFSGKFPLSIGDISSLKQLDVAQCNFSEGTIPSSIGNLRQLTYLDISANKFIGSIPESFANLTQLFAFRICSTLVTGSMPSWIGNFSKLVNLDFSFSRFNGAVLASFSNLTNLEIFDLQFNQLRGIVDFKSFQYHRNLYHFDLSDNNIEFRTDTMVMNSTIPQFQVLGLAGCNLTQFPYFLRYQQKLENLYLDNNRIYGQVPKWMLNMSTDSLTRFNLGNNLLSGFEKLPDVLPWVNLGYLGLQSNMFNGQLPVPAGSTLGYEAQNNNFNGNIPKLLCNMSSLLALDISSNNFTGTIPRCLGKFSDNLTLLLLSNNSLHGSLPLSYNNRSKLRMLDVSHNHLEGKLPRSLSNCLILETIILSNNNFSDVFPFWLATLPELKVLTLRHNSIHGVMGKPEHNQRFPKLRLLDISYNNITGNFIAEDIFVKNAMVPNIKTIQTTYIVADVRYELGNGVVTLYYGSRITITTKGVERYYSKILEDLALIDISCNKFEGEIDEWIGNLNGLRSLNVSFNLLSGGIPSSLGSLTDMESLDLSNNKLSGMIPQQLAQLSFMSQFNVSHNNLTGRIPSGTQLQGFDATSYEGNSGLCGDPLPTRCEDSNIPGQSEENDLESEVEFDMTFMFAGYGSGLAIGVVLTEVTIRRWPGLFLKIVEILIRLVARITIWNKFRRCI